MSISAAKETKIPAHALSRLLEQLRPVPVETLETVTAWGRVLAEPLWADRDSPPSSVSAMDGYAVRLADLNGRPIPIGGEVAIGQAPLRMEAGMAIRIFTGGCVPPECEAVIRREDLEESETAVHLRVDPHSVRRGDNIRYQGENAQSGQIVVVAGRQIDSAAASAMAAFGMHRPQVFRKVRVGILVTGNELLPPNCEPKPWELRDSNSWALQGMLSTVPWIEVVRRIRTVDALPAIVASLQQLLSRCDAVFITGGVSMGDHDYVPAAVREAGCRTLIHKLPIRPGKPLLGAVGPQGQAILGLPGNPVSVTVTARRFGVPTLRTLAGFSRPELPCPVLRLAEPDRQAIKLWWHRPVRLSGSGCAECVPNNGSGDLVGVASSDGFVEIPPDATNFDSLPFWSWTVGS